MGTTYLMSETGVLRHGHPANAYNPKFQWHEADRVHRDDPNGHERELSWDVNSASWSRLGRYVSMDRRAELINQAHKRHDARVTSGDYGDYIEPPKAEVTDTSETTATTVQIDTALTERVSNLEDIALATAERADAAKTTAERLANKAIALENSVMDVRVRVANTESEIKLHTRGISELDDRLSIVEKQAAAKPIEIVVRTTTETHSLTGVFHAYFEKLLMLATALEPEDRNIWISGAAGSGKTTVARQLAEVLNLPFKYHGAIDSPYKLSGFIDGNGNYHRTAFRDIYENGGVILLDECDGSSPGALLEINGALANSHASFPDGMVPRHKDCYALCSANTWGFGGDAQYFRNKLDAAFLDRFVTLAWPYDETLECQLAGVPATSETRTLPTFKLTAENNTTTITDWVRTVQTVRHAYENSGAPGVVISPRASIKGAQLLRGGLSPAFVVEAIFSRYRNHSTWKSIGTAAEDFAKRTTTGTSSAASNGTASKLTVDMSKAQVFGARR